jgi:starvation-inducible DNA-binding protein
MTDTDVRLFPAPEPLATPTDLASEEVQKVAEAVNPVVADAFALYVKTKNYHWHLSGSHFYEYHLLLDEQAESILSSIDPLAERMRRIGATTIRSVSHVNRLQSIEDDNEEFVHPGEMMRRLLEDNRRIAETHRKAHDICESAKDAATAGLLEGTIDETEKRIWFLYEITRGGENTG